MNDINLAKTIHEAVNKRIDEAINEEVQSIVEDAKKRIEKKIPEIVAGVAILTQCCVSVNNFGNELSVLIKMEQP